MYSEAEKELISFALAAFELPKTPFGSDAYWMLGSLPWEIQKVNVIDDGRNPPHFVESVWIPYYGMYGISQDLVNLHVGMSLFEREDGSKFYLGFSYKAGKIFYQEKEQ